LLIAYLALWIVVLFFGFLLLGALRAVALLRWQVAQLEATMPNRVGRSGLRPGKRAPKFTLPSIAGDTAGGEVGLEHYAGRKLLLVFMQPGCGPCLGITPELNRLHDAGEVRVLAIYNGDTEAVRGWVKGNRPHFSAAVQEHFNVSKRYEVFATPFAFLIDERGVISSRGIVSTKQYLGFVLARAGHDEKEGGSAPGRDHPDRGLGRRRAGRVQRTARMRLRDRRLRPPVALEIGRRTCRVTVRPALGVGPMPGRPSRRRRFGSIGVRPSASLASKMAASIPPVWTTRKVRVLIVPCGVYSNSRCSIEPRVAAVRPVLPLESVRIIPTRQEVDRFGKSLQEVVHFYNTRNIAVNANGQQVAFDLRKGPPAGFTAIWPPPEVLDNVQNVAGFTPAQAAARGTTGVTAENGQVGNLGLTASQEADLVNFLKILTDGFTRPNPVGP
jgi:methylamine dehydrogenase accessory protein MauD